MAAKWRFSVATAPAALAASLVAALPAAALAAVAVPVGPRPKVIPSLDQLAFAVTKRTGLKSLREIRERRLPLRVSLRGQRDHALHPVVNEVFRAAGFSLDDIVSWGGQVRYDEGLPQNNNRLGAVARGEVDMVVDEAVRGWINSAAGSGMRALPLEETMLARLEAAQRRERLDAG